ncbi:MAG: ABC transporter substrate-binding protein [Nitrospinae bacterium]|nr:ABC transporter substrate-binding protein [Nitrospinota bacterium]
MERVFPVIHFQYPKSIHLPGLLLQRIFQALCLLLLLIPAPGTLAKDLTQAHRIISTSPSITETLFALGLEDRVVGVTDFCKYPPKACQLASVGGLVNPHMETIVALRPDLVVHLAHSVRLEQNTQKLGIPSMKLEMDTVENILGSIQLLGVTLGVEKNAGRLQNKLINGINLYKKKLKNIPPKEALLLLGDSSDPGRDLYAAGQGTFLHELLEISGGRNIIPDSLAQYPKITKEFIIQKSPEVIIEAGPKSRLSLEQIKERMKGWKRFPSIRAVQSEQIHYIGADYILIPGPRLLKILGQFSRALHPEIFSDSSPSKTENKSSP